MRRCLLIVIGSLLLNAISPFATRAADPPPLPDYFKAEVSRISSKPLAGITSAQEWKARRAELQDKLVAMLGLRRFSYQHQERKRFLVVSPNDSIHGNLVANLPLEIGMNFATPFGGMNGGLTLPDSFKVQIVGKVERPDFVIEKLIYRSAPGLYVTGNLYRPKDSAKSPLGKKAGGGIAGPPRLPTILYVCGHSKNETDGIVEGCKAHYQHHAAWYAANGYICLVIDTLQLGELPGLHHGTNRFGMWWWASLGYTPAGIEALNATRAIDYLCSRLDVDQERIGVTGRSGGGATSWWVGAIDDRVSTVIPVAGITDLQNHVNDGVIEGHCDCMFHFNTERWDFDTIAALVAPKALLVENTDKDPIFPEDGVRRVYSQLERVYEWYGAKDKLGLVIGKGGHADTPELRHPSFAFMDKWLARIDRPVTEPDRHVPHDQLIVLKENLPPADCRNAFIHESFIQPVRVNPPQSAANFAYWSDGARNSLSSQVFNGWPTIDVVGPTQVKRGPEIVRGPFLIRRFDFISQEGVPLSFWSIERSAKDAEVKGTRVEVIDPASWTSTWASILDPAKKTPISVGDGTPEWLAVHQRALEGMRVLLLLPRGVGPTAWPVERDKHTRRRYLLLGQSLDGQRAWDVTRAIAAAKDLLLLPESRRISPETLQFGAAGEATTWLLWALVMSEPTRGLVEFHGLPESVLEGPAYPAIARVLDMPQAVTLLFPAKVRLNRATNFSAWKWSLDVSGLIGSNDWLTIR